MENLKSTLIRNLKKGIKTAKTRINKGLEGRKLVYALRYIKGAKTRLRKLEGSGISKIINKVSKVSNISGISKIINKALSTITNKIKGIRERIEENKKEREFIKRWEDLEEGDR